jgi:hypothetical protein
MPMPLPLLTHDQLLQCFRTSLLCGRERGDGCSIVNERCTGLRWGMHSIIHSYETLVAKLLVLREKMTEKMRDPLVLLDVEQRQPERILC